MWYMGPSAMEQPVSSLRAPQFTLILVRTGNPNSIPKRMLEEGGWSGGLHSGLAMFCGPIV